MTFIVYEDKPDIRLGKIVSQSAGALHVENIHGKQQKIKDKAIYLSWENPKASADLWALAEHLSQSLDPQFLWEVSGEGEFHFSTLSTEYFGTDDKDINAVGQKIAILICLRNNPIFFRRGPEGRFSRAEAKQVAAALSGMEKRKAQESAIADMVEKLKAKTLPDSIAKDWARLLFEKTAQPTLEAKALAEAIRDAGVSPAEWLLQCGAFNNWHAYFLQAFLAVDYPDKITPFALLPPTIVADSLAQWPIVDLGVPIFTIDDESTDEIDDALSVERLNAGDGYRIGIHIAAPAIMADSAWQSQPETITRFANRLSTVYWPGSKIPMMGHRQPESADGGNTWVDVFSLDEGIERPTVSLFITVSHDMVIKAVETKLHRLKISANLRLQSVEAAFNQAVECNNNMLEDLGKAIQSQTTCEGLMTLWQFAKMRIDKRNSQGASIGNHHPEYRYDINDEGRVSITLRPRGSPLDALVAEMMIFANETWSSELKSANIPAIYRVKDESKVGFSTEPGGHKSMGLSCYGWYTSPLRRFVDFVNQRQLIALKTHTPAPLKAGEVSAWNIDLATIAMQANILHGVYGEFQRKMERYFCLRWLQQEGRATYQATLSQRGRNPYVMLDDIPLTLQLSKEAIDTLIQRGIDHFSVRIKKIDEENLLVSSEVVS